MRDVWTIPRDVPSHYVTHVILPRMKTFFYGCKFNDISNPGEIIFEASGNTARDIYAALEMEAAYCTRLFQQTK